MNLRSLPSMLVGLALGVSGVAFGLAYAAKSHSNSAPSDPAVSAVEKGAGIITKPSNHSVDETVAKLKAMLQAKGVKLFTLVDHSGEAAKVGLKMPNTKLLIF